MSGGAPGEVRRLGDQTVRNQIDNLAVRVPIDIPDHYTMRTPRVEIPDMKLVQIVNTTITPRKYERSDLSSNNRGILARLMQF